MRATLIVTHNDADFIEAKALVEALMTSEDPRDRARVKAQARLLEGYERVKWPRRPATLPSLLLYLMGQHGLSRAGMVPLLGTSGRVREVLNGKRELSLTMVRRLRERFNSSADLLISRGPTKRAGRKMAA
jgi:HTH-type transcriptional regulator / antitoxin HigA